ncbi:AzlD domain-containing protein [Ruminococcus sp. 210702-SL.1.03]|uniref:AzlD domain-containing protein n=1 Tax=Ruminococcus sp. 210702-SL.1.03 TaxID=2883233 RepID=UPI0015A8CF21|nr:AzlD domain-containing protein [Ruminococcus sp. 210702-SL.1.03]MCB6616429.1 AzlD domain-containing protein [Ruminococcus sp. 210702-SL.1.03]
MQTVIYIAIMAGVTYLIRMLPIMVFRRKIKSQVVQSFLYYVPYAVLGAMTIPAVFYSTGSMAASAAGFAAAFAAAFFGRSLITVALAASAAAYAVMLIF